MRTLTLIRHAKSSLAGAGLADADRHLAPRGLAAGPVLAGWLAEHVAKPGLVLCSTALRTRATWAMLAYAWGDPPPPCTFSDALYMAGSGAMLKLIGQTPAEVAHLLIVGHNPGLHDLAIVLAGLVEAEDLRALSAKFPTAGVAVFSVDGPPWSAVKPAPGTLLHFVSPRRLAPSA